MNLDGISAFPLTPFVDDRLDETAFAALVGRIAGSGVTSVTALGSTGSYAYLSRDERAAAIEIAVEHAGATAVFAGIGATRTRHVIEHADDAARAGAQALLLAPVSYQPLSDEEVFGLFRDVSANTERPIIVYDNPRTTGYAFTPEMYARVAELPGVAALKVPGRPRAEAAALLERIRTLVPANVSVNFSGDAYAAGCIDAGYDGWYSVLAGTLPELALALWSSRDDSALSPLWDLYAESGGGLRVMAAIAELRGWAAPACLPRPLLGLSVEQRTRLEGIMTGLGV